MRLRGLFVPLPQKTASVPSLSTNIHVTVY